jgi:hypothetical protein
VKRTFAAACVAAVAALAVLTAVGASAETKGEKPYADNSVVNSDTPGGSVGMGPK